MKYNQSFFVFIYFCMVINPLYTMQSSLINTAKNRLITKNTKINAIIKKKENSEKNVTKNLTKIGQISEGKLRDDSLYGSEKNVLKSMYYHNTGDAFFAITPQGCFLTTKQGSNIHKISDIAYHDNTSRQLAAIHDEIIIIAGKKNVELHNICTNTKKLLNQKDRTSFICFSSKNNCILTLSKGDNDNGYLKKYDKNGNFISLLITEHPARVKFATYQSLLLIVNDDWDKPQITLKLYNLLNFTLLNTYQSSDLIKNLHNLNPIKNCHSCQISDDGLVAFIGGDETLKQNKLYIFDATNQNELVFKHAIDCEAKDFKYTKFYPTTSILLTISYFPNGHHFIRYWDIKRETCLHKASAFGINDLNDFIHSIDFSPYGDKVAITSYGCTLEKVPTLVACNHAKNKILYLLLLNELCNQNQKFCGLIPREIKLLIAQNIFV